MLQKGSRGAVPVLALAVLGMPALITARASAQVAAERIVFTSVNGVRDMSVATEPTIIRSRTVRFNPTRSVVLECDAGKQLIFELFDDATVVAVVERSEWRSPEERVVVGHLADEPSSSFALVVRRNVMVGNFRVPGEPLYQIRYQGNGVHVVRQIDVSLFPPCGGASDDPTRGLVDSTPPPKHTRGSGSGCVDDGSLIDMLALYTGQARLAAGGIDGIKAIITLAETETNQAYLNSQIDTRLRVLMTYEVAYFESGTSYVDRNRLSRTSDGFMDEVHPLRELVGADVMSLLVGWTDVCGIAAFAILPGNTPYPPNAVNVVRLSCATGNYTFGHELGHNQGCRHDRQVDTADGAFSYSHGHVEPGNAFRTMMGVSGVGAQRIQYFSNPEILYDGYPTGVPAGEPESADCALSVDNVSFDFANFRVRDCNQNGICDDEDITSGTSADCSGNLIPDECEPDCNNNGVTDSCDIFNLPSGDCTANGIPDECEADCNTNDVADSCDILNGTSSDCNFNQIPDDCDPGGGPGDDCNENGTVDLCDVFNGTSLDCNENENPDDCDVADGTSLDENANGVPDECDYVIYVDQSASGADDGSSWADAFIDLEEAIDYASIFGSDVTEIWVARGLYTPGRGDADPNAHFNIVDEVSIYGGFEGGASRLDQRDLLSNETILSGDIGIEGDPSDNVYTVVHCGTSILRARLDGFTITQGNANGPGGYDKLGGGIRAGQDCNATFANCRIVGNSASTGGGAYLQYSMTSWINCVFAANNATGNGGGISSQQSTPTFINCTFSGNHAGGSVGALNFTGGPAILANCVLWGNLDAGGTGESAQISTGDVQISQCDIQGWSGALGGVGNFGDDPLFLAEPDAGPDGNWDGVDDDYGNLHLRSGSPCLDAGNNSIITVTHDIEGYPRIGDGDDDGIATVDLGAFEYRPQEIPEIPTLRGKRMAYMALLMLASGVLIIRRRRLVHSRKS